MTPTIKPGTRCECGDNSCPHVEAAIAWAGSTGSIPPDCELDAVRMVTVNRSGRIDEAALDYVPMCGPCAEWHEKEAK